MTFNSFNPPLKKFSRPLFDPSIKPVKPWKVFGAVLLAILFVSFIASVK